MSCFVFMDPTNSLEKKKKRKPENHGCHIGVTVDLTGVVLDWCCPPCLRTLGKMAPDCQLRNSVYSATSVKGWLTVEAYGSHLREARGCSG